MGFSVCLWLWCSALPLSPLPSTSSLGGYEVPATDSHEQKKEVQLFSFNFSLYPYTGHKWTMLQKAIDILSQK